MLTGNNLNHRCESTHRLYICLNAEKINERIPQNLILKISERFRNICIKNKYWERLRIGISYYAFQFILIKKKDILNDFCLANR